MDGLQIFCVLLHCCLNCDMRRGMDASFGSEKYHLCYSFSIFNSNRTDFHFGNSNSYINFLINFLIYFLIFSNIFCYFNSFKLKIVLADRFFHNRERLIATSIGVYSNYAGIGLGYLISPLIVGNDEVIR